MNEHNQAETIDSYISEFPESIQERMKELRKVIKEEAPESKEIISWRMPTFVLHGNLVHFAGFAHHIGFYPGSEGIAAFQEEIKEYKSSKGAVQFPHHLPLPLELVRRIVAYRVQQNNNFAEAKKNKKKG